MSVEGESQFFTDQILKILEKVSINYEPIEIKKYLENLENYSTPTNEQFKNSLFIKPKKN
jgi:ribosomal protein L12E/L44/L45/RPP1/RPP2